MRTMLSIHIDAIKGSEALKAGAMQKAIMGFIEKFKPEATYFTLVEGMRAGFFRGRRSRLCSMRSPGSTCGRS